MCVYVCVCAWCRLLVTVNVYVCCWLCGWCVVCVCVIAGVCDVVVNGNGSVVVRLVVSVCVHVCIRVRFLLC